MRLQWSIRLWRGQEHIQNRIYPLLLKYEQENSPFPKKKKTSQSFYSGTQCGNRDHFIPLSSIFIHRSVHPHTPNQADNFRRNLILFSR